MMCPFFELPTTTVLDVDDLILSRHLKKYVFRRHSCDVLPKVDDPTMSQPLKKYVFWRSCQEYPKVDGPSMQTRAVPFKLALARQVMQKTRMT